MKELPEEQLVRKKFESGTISKNGFLGEDTRHIHDIIQEDQRTLSRLGLRRKDIAVQLQRLIDEGKKGLESVVDKDEFTIQVRWARGMLPCPFGEPGLHHKLSATIFIKDLKREITFSQLSVHMIKAHGFFGGKGSAFRLNPDELGVILGLEK